MADQIPAEVKEARNQALLDILEKSSRERNKSLLHTRQEVLVEGPSKKGPLFTGRTRGNRVVLFEANERLIGELAQVEIDRVTTSSLYGFLPLQDVSPARQTEPAEAG